MKYETSELTGEILIRALRLAMAGDDLVFSDGSLVPSKYDPEHNWAQCGELIDKFGVTVKPNYETIDGVHQWTAFIIGSELFGLKSVNPCVQSGNSAQQAICRAVVAVFYGNEVEI